MIEKRNYKITMLIGTLFFTARKWNQTGFPSRHELIKKIWYVYIKWATFSSKVKFAKKK